MEARWGLCLALAALAAHLCSCHSVDQPRLLPSSPPEAFAQLAAAAKANDTTRVYHLLDTPSQWSLMSLQRDQKAACTLVQQHYPRERQARELQRCRDGAIAKDAQELFSTLARRHRLLAPLATLEEAGAISGEGKRRVIASKEQQLPFCQDRRGQKQGWSYCGLRERFEQLKVKAARDLSAIEENVEIFKRR